MKAYIAEVFGTFCLVFIGCSSVITGGFGGLLPGGAVGIALAFGIAVVAMAYAIGPVSGAHLNPAVSLGAFLAGRLPASDLIGYIVAQVVGGIIGAVVLWIIASGHAGGAPANLAATGWDAAAGYSTAAAFITETVATFVFVTVILGVTNAKHTTVLAGLVIGLTLLCAASVLHPGLRQFAQPGALDRAGAVFGRRGDRTAVALHRRPAARRRDRRRGRQGRHLRKGLSLRSSMKSRRRIIAPPAFLWRIAWAVSGLVPVAPSEPSDHLREPQGQPNPYQSDHRHAGSK